MTSAIGDPDFARSGAFGQQAAQRALVQTVIEAEGGWAPLDSVENAQKRLEMAMRLTAEGYLNGSQGGVVVKGVEAWLRAEDLRHTRRRMAELEATIVALKAELREREAKRGR